MKELNLLHLCHACDYVFLCTLAHCLVRDGSKIHVVQWIVFYIALAYGAFDGVWCIEQCVFVYC